jgi:hypothetical protein
MGLRSKPVSTVGVLIPAWNVGFVYESDVRTLAKRTKEPNSIHPLGVGRRYLALQWVPMGLWTSIACLFGISASLWSGTSENSQSNVPQVLTPRQITRRVPLVDKNDT